VCVCVFGVDSVPNGKGKMMYKNGSVYQGEWVDGQRHGLGICCFESGSKYDLDLRSFIRLEDEFRLTIVN